MPSNILKSECSVDIDLNITDNISCSEAPHLEWVFPVYSGAAIFGAGVQTMPLFVLLIFSIFKISALTRNLSTC